jgi:NADPH-dependent ferric siderophore reductase
VQLRGPGGAYSPEPEADWHLLAGDESALPAITVALGRVPAGAQVAAFVEVDGPEDELELDAEITWLHRGERPVGELLVQAVRDWPQPAGTGQVFVHGEAAMVRELRSYLRVECGLAVARLSISGYWRAGVDDEGWRAVKRDWNRDIEESEARILAG